MRLIHPEEPGVDSFEGDTAQVPTEAEERASTEEFLVAAAVTLILGSGAVCWAVNNPQVIKNFLT